MLPAFDACFPSMSKNKSDRIQHFSNGLRKPNLFRNLTRPWLPSNHPVALLDFPAYPLPAAPSDSNTSILLRPPFSSSTLPSPIPFREVFESFVMLHIGKILWFEFMQGCVGMSQLEVNDKQSAWTKVKPLRVRTGGHVNQEVIGGVQEELI
jgi:hypothetical protein